MSKSATAALLAHVVSTSPLGPANATYQLLGTAKRPESEDPDVSRECGCGWTEHYFIDHATLTVTDHYCTGPGGDGEGCNGSPATSVRDVLELLDAEAI